MELANVKSAVAATPAGANIVLEWNRSITTRKTSNSVITKQTRMVGRIGLSYDNIAAVQEKRYYGDLPIENAGLPWGEWADDQPSKYPSIVVNKGTYYLRIYNGTSASSPIETQWTMDGEECSYEDVLPHLLAKDKRKPDSTRPDTMTIKVKDILRINKAATTPEVAQEKTEAEQVEEVLAES